MSAKVTREHRALASPMSELKLADRILSPEYDSPEAFAAGWGSLGPIFLRLLAYLDEQHTQREATSSGQPRYLSEELAALRSALADQKQLASHVCEENEALRAVIEAEREAHRQTQAKLEAVRSRMGRPGLGIPLSEFDDLGPCANCEHPQYQHKGSHSHCTEVSKGRRCKCGVFRAR